MARKILSNLDLQGNQAISLQVENLGADPTGAGLFDGRLWLYAPYKQLRYFTSADGGVTNILATERALSDTVNEQDWKPSARVATTGPITLSGLQTIDGVALAAGDRVLVKNQASTGQNSIYVAASGSWDYADDMRDALTQTNVSSGATAYVESGTVNGQSIWTVTTPSVPFANSAKAWTRVWSALFPYVTNPMSAQDDVIIGAAAGSPARLGKGANGTYLGIDGTGHLAYGVPIGFANPLTASQDILYRNAAGNPAPLVKGANGTYLRVNASTGLLEYGALPSSMIYRAAWSSATAYVPGDVVLLAGQYWWCGVANTNTTPPNTSFWVNIGFANPMTTPGDLIVAGGSGTPARLPGAAGLLHGAVGSGPTFSPLALADIPANLISTIGAIAPTFGQTTSNTGNVPVTNSSLATTSAGGKYLIGIIGSAQNSVAGNYIALSLLEDGVSLGSFWIMVSASNFAYCNFGGVYMRANPGNHTYSLSWRVSGGTATLASSVLNICELSR